jgi:hypothetical protein
MPKQSTQPQMGRLSCTERQWYCEKNDQIYKAHSLRFVSNRRTRRRRVEGSTVESLGEVPAVQVHMSSQQVPTQALHASLQNNAKVDLLTAQRLLGYSPENTEELVAWVMQSPERLNIALSGPIFDFSERAKGLMNNGQVSGGSKTLPDGDTQTVIASEVSMSDYQQFEQDYFSRFSLLENEIIKGRWAEVKMAEAGVIPDDSSELPPHEHG